MSMLHSFWIASSAVLASPAWDNSSGSHCWYKPLLRTLPALIPPTMLAELEITDLPDVQAFESACAEPAARAIRHTAVFIAEACHGVVSPA